MIVEDWRYRAACRGQDLELFFPIASIGPAATHLAAAQQVCASCPVREECLRWSMEHHIDHGVWGGLSEDQRRALRRRTAPPRHASAGPR